SLAVTLDGETARLQLALQREDSDFEDCPMRVFHDLHSEVQTLKDEVNIILDKASLESQQSVGFIKATKILMKKNSVDIMKMKEFFQKYGYNPHAKKNSSSECENPEKPDMKDDLLDSAALSTSVSEKSPRILPNPPQAVNNPKEEPKCLTSFSKQSLIKIPKCALKMDDFECVTPKLEHFGISEYTMCLNDTETTEIEPVTSDSVFATPGLKTQPLEKNDAEHTHSPFCTPGLKLPSTKSSTALCFEKFAGPSSPMISSYKNLLKTPTPPAILSKYNSNLATLVAVRVVPPSKLFLPRHGGRNM
ncbi:hypothetical protein FD755_016643, partial [Muntiacus reevesi]